jgi:hypothetical protein
MFSLDFANQTTRRIREKAGTFYLQFTQSDAARTLK